MLFFPRRPIALFLFLMLLLAPLGAQEASVPASDLLPRLADIVDAAWPASPAWSDGSSETATYRAERVLFGETRLHTMRLLTVQEDINKQYWTKADWPYGQKPLLPAIRQSQIAVIETPPGTMNLMASLFFDRARIDHCVKATFSSQEMRGTTHKEVRFDGTAPVFSWNSFWDGEGTGSLTLPGWGSNTYLEEELHLLVRTIRFREGLTCRLELAPLQLTNNAAVPKPSDALLDVARETERITVPAGSYEPGSLWRVIVETRDGRTLQWHVADAAPNVLVKFEASDGRNFALQEVVRQK